MLMRAPVNARDRTSTTMYHFHHIVCSVSTVVKMTWQPAVEDLCHIVVLNRLSDLPSFVFGADNGNIEKKL
jgi:hypothetical protein